jgi:DNA-binding MarR family transcriptional regulator
MMNLAGRSGVFGTRTRSNLLILLELLEESHASELARLAGVRLFTVQSALDSLEQAGLVVGIAVGRERRVRLNPRFYAHKELRALLSRMASEDTELSERLSELRRRPRRAGKKL